ncbi:MAG TPA: cellulase family glycosylhydrolase [Acidimicrobiales bacterium]|nr:cellulase family glycosylhydrolase [Acidimicrobiales bacterium]
MTKRIRRSALCAVVAAAAGLFAPAAASSTSPAWAASSAPRYGTHGLWVTDSAGRRLVLRGVDVMGAEFTPTSQPLPYGPSDFAAIRATGATVVRIPIAWANIEPRPGFYDPAAIARAVQVVRWAGQAGLLVVLDMHQWGWSPCFGGNGVPAWEASPCPDLAGTVGSVPGVSAVPGEGLAVGTGIGQFVDPAPSETAFWTTTSLQQQFTEAWVDVARALGAPKWLLGYDLLNEPPNGLIPPGVFEGRVLPAFYRMVGSALRRVDPGALLFVEPALVHSAATAASSFAVPIGLPRVVYAAHEYGTSLNDSAGDVADVAGPSQFAPDLALTRLQAQRMGAAWWLGEWGAVNPYSTLSYDSGAYNGDMLNAQDADMLGSAYWTYVHGGYWAQSDVTRMAPFAVAGTPESFSTGTHAMTLRWAATGGTTAISLPAGTRPVLQVSTGALVSSVVVDTDGTVVPSGGAVGPHGGWMEIVASPGTVQVELAA